MSIASRLKSRLSVETIAAILAIALGLILRLRQISINLTFWLDEAMLALNIINRSFLGLVEPLDYNQGAPPGFLWVSKAMVTLLGNHEYALRLFPFLASCAALFLLWLLARQLTRPFGVMFTLLIFASSHTIVSYAAQFKQYAVDVAITLLLYLLALSLLRKVCFQKDYILMALLGSLSIWMSHPAVFTLAGIGIMLMAISIIKKDRAGMRGYFFVGILWLLNFAALYFIQFRSLASNNFLSNYWSEFFMPLTPAAPGWVLSSLAGLFRAPAGLSEAVPTILILGLFFGGAISLFWMEKRWIWMFTLSILFALVASSLGKYPFGGRFGMFAIPGLLICVGEGLELLRRAFMSSGLTAGPILGRVSVILLVGYMLYTPLVLSIEAAFKPGMAENITYSLASLKANYRKDDVIYLHPMSIPAFRYYAPKFGLENASVFNGSDFHENRQAYQAEVAGLAGYKRVWFLFSHLTDTQYTDDLDAILKYANLVGVKKREFSEPGTLIKLYLYELTP